MSWEEWDDASCRRLSEVCRSAWAFSRSFSIRVRVWVSLLDLLQEFFDIAVFVAQALAEAL